MGAGLSRIRRRLLTVAMLLCSVGGLSSPTLADDVARDDPTGARELAERYAPIIVLKAQEAACDDAGEPYAPTSADIVLDNPEVLLRQVGSGNPVVMRGPGAADLAGLGEGFFLDFPGSSLEPGCIFERDFRRYADGLPVTVYAHIVQEVDHPDQLALQYWFYWYYNDWNNKHESDWEGIQLLFDASSIDEALDSDPASVGYAQHEGGERAEWNSSKLERDGSHPVVYSSAGSHASYFDSAVYLGRSASEGFGCDTTSGPSERVLADVVVLPDSVTDAGDPLAWLSYEGRWGERQSGAFNGPTGPSNKERWTEPVAWHETLRESSVAVPTGSSFGARVVEKFCGTVEWGSKQLTGLTTSPVRLLLSLGLVVLGVAWSIRRTVWTQVTGTPVVMRRRAGQIIRLSYAIYRRRWKRLLLFGAAYLPAALLAGLVAALFAMLPLVSNVVDLVGDDSGAGLGLALTAGGLPAVVAAFVVNALVAGHLDSPESDRSPRHAASSVWVRRRPLARTLARSFGIVTVLALSVVGIPWAIRQTVRYQFSAQVLMVEGLEGRQALDRSSDLVRGRWFHTAALVMVFNALPLITGLVVGLLLLLAAAGLPLWMFSVTMSFVYALLVPLAATAKTYLYGDAVAEFDEADQVGPALDTIDTIDTVDA